jgi:solute carrier family 25 protein 38
LVFSRVLAALPNNQYHLTTPFIHAISAFSAGLAATTITHPFDVLRARIQLQPTVYTNAFRAATKIYREERFRGFFIGIVPRTLKKTLSAALTWTVYEEIVRLL